MLFIGSAANAAVSSSLVNEWEELENVLRLDRSTESRKKERKKHVVALHRDEKAAADCSTQDGTWQPEKTGIKVDSFWLVPKSVNEQ